MKRSERVKQRASKLEKLGVRRAVRATSLKNKLGRGAIRDGKLAQKAYDLARQLRQYAIDLERSAAREAKNKPKKLPREWWK